MYSRESTLTQLTFHYVDGRTESYNLYAPIEQDGVGQTTQLEVRHLFKKEWWIINLPEETVFINLDKVLKVEMKPPISYLQGEDVFANAERVTALNRSR